MSKIAQQLCDEIVEPALNTSSPRYYEDNRCNSNGKIKKTIQHYPVTLEGTPSGNATRSVIIEKQKIITNLGPSKSGSKHVISQFKSKDLLLKKHLADIAVNTTLTGPVRCDIKCNTMVRQRQPETSCKCGNMRTCTRPYKSNMKPKSSLHLFRDKACAHVIETSSCGTQFLNNTLQAEIPQEAMATQTFQNAHVEVGIQSLFVADVKPHKNTIVTKRFPTRTYQKPLEFIQMPNPSNSSNRWALTRYPTMGPDF